MDSIPVAGGPSEALVRQAHQWWADAAGKAGIDLSGFRSDASLADRVAWAMSVGLAIGVILSRFSSKLQHSTSSQVEECLRFAGFHNLYVPPEFVCVDEGISGRKSRREGLDRAKHILKRHLAQTLLVYKVSRLFRVAYKGYAFFQEEVVEEGLRAISVSQGIDTLDERTWKGLTYLHGIMDEMLLTAIADHVRSGIVALFTAGYVTGALTVGYRRVEVPDARPTNRGRPRTAPQVDDKIGAMIRQHYDLIRCGMSIKEGWRRWVAASGPCDPRSKLGHMSYGAYRRMLSNPRYTGLWAFGRKKNVWSSKRDYTQQIVQPETDVVIYRCEELRIVDDELFAEVQERLAEFKTGPRGPRKRKNIQLWDLTTEFFYCAHCKVRFYLSGANGHGMRCKRGDLCPAKSAVRRQDAVRAICDKLTELLGQNAGLLEAIAGRAVELDSHGDESLRRELEVELHKEAALSRKIDDLMELAGQGTDEDRKETRGKVQSAQAQRSAVRSHVAKLRKSLEGGSATLTPDQVRAMLADLTGLLVDAAGGRLGEDAVYRALAVFRQLTGGRVWVHVERRTGRKRTVVSGVFRPELVTTVRRQGALPECGGEEPASEVTVWLRSPPRLDAIAERVHQLLDVDGVSYRDAAQVLQREGHNVNSGNVWYSYRRWYAMHGLPLPKRPYNNGRPRRSR